MMGVELMPRDQGLSALDRRAFSPHDCSGAQYREASLKADGYSNLSVLWLLAKRPPRIAGHTCPGVGEKARHPAILPQRRGHLTRHGKLKKSGRFRAQYMAG